MSTLTLEKIEAAQTELAKMIEKFKRQASTFPLTIDIPQLNDGEQYVGAVVSADGTRKHHIILLAGEKDAVNWKDANKWAASIGGELPDRVEGALLYATLKDEFKPEWYWLREQHAASSDYAWVQSFGNGRQDYYDKNNQFRARAVRRLPI